MKSQLARLSLLVTAFFLFAPPLGVAYLMSQTGGDKFTVAQVLSSPFPSSLVASKQGARIAWIFDRQGHKSIWCAEGPGFAAKQLVEFPEDDGQALTLAGFSFDGGQLVFSRGSDFNASQKVAGAEASEPTLYRVAWDGGGPQKLAQAASAELSNVSNIAIFARDGNLWKVDLGGNAEPEKILSVRGSLSQLRFAPSDDRVAFRISRSSTGERYSFIALLNPGAAALEYLDASVYQDGSPQWSPDGNRIAFLRRLTQGGPSGLNAREYPHPDPWQIRVFDLQNKTVQPALRAPEDVSFSQAEMRWVSNNNLVFSSERDGWRRLYTVAAGGGRLRELSPERAEVEDFVVHSDGRIFFSTNAGDIDRRHLWVAKGRTVRPITSGEGIEWSPTPTANGEFLAHFASNARLPAQAFVRSLETEANIHLAPEALPTDFPMSQLAVPEQVIMRAADGVAVHAQLFRPAADFAGPRPAVMFFHGGPVRQMLLGWHYRKYYHNTYAINQYLAARGYYVLSVNYRLGIGYGKAFRDVPDGGPRGASEYQDLLAGAKYLRALPEVDSGRIGLWGGSYGGYLTALGLARNSDLFAAGVDLHGVHDWNQWQAWSAGAPVEVQQQALLASPVSDLHTWRSPVLLVHGDDDRNVPFSETMRLVRELEDRDVDYELMILPDEVHSFLRHDSWVHVAEKTAAFFDRKLRDLATPTAAIRSGAARYLFNLEGTPLEAFTYKPANYDGSRMIFVMHGVLRNADEYRDHAIAMGERFGALIVAPRFDSERFPSRKYQFGGVLDAEGTAVDSTEWTYALLPKLAKFVRTMENRPGLPFSIIGHSAGGQFVARMSAFFDPGAERLVAANPGSELFPTLDMEFGYGFGGLPDELADERAMQRYLAAPLTLYLGTADNGPDNYFDRSERAMRQGEGRWQRGKACFEFAQQLASERGWEFNWRLVEAEGIGHDHEMMFNHDASEQALFGK